MQWCSNYTAIAVRQFSEGRCAKSIMSTSSRGAVYVILLLTVLVVVLGAVQSRLTAHPPGSVTLAWDPPSSPCLTEFRYNLYRGDKSGSYSAQPVNERLIKTEIHRYIRVHRQDLLL